MFFRQPVKFFSLIILLASSSAFAESKLNLGVAYDLDTGITAQYRGYSFFLNDDAAAIDYRLENFSNTRKSLHFYIDIGGFIQNDQSNNDNSDDSVGIRTPIGMTFGFAKNFHAYIQAVPNYDFNNDRGFDVDGAIGVRYQF